ncbi:MAG: UvrD-helicase domain-containing protein [Deltaproteobacteria bacterium]|nr:UvrD-helicase domain-containing protein [Deltaproteobacteria bacterium]
MERWPIHRFKILERFTPEKLANKTNKGKATPEHPFFDTCGKLRGAYDELCEYLSRRRIEFERELIRTVASQSRARKELKGQQSYDDLLWQVARALEPPGGRLLAARLRRQYHAALVDEFQDTDRLQYQILRNIWHRDAAIPDDDDPSPPALFLIGDPKQAIYAFRGADVYAYLMAKEDAGERCFTLDTNWRSDPSMIEGVNCLFKRSDSPFRLEGIPFEEIEPRPGARDRLERSAQSPEKCAALDILFMSRSEDKPMTKVWGIQEIPWRVAADVAELIRGAARIEGRPVRPDDVAILCKTNRQTEVICRELRRIGIPAAILGSASVFDAPEAGEIERLLDAAAEPGSAGRIRAALATGIFGLTGEELENLASDEEAWEERLLQFRRWHEDWRERGFIHMFHQLFREARVHVRLLGLEDGERRLTNFLHLAELLERAVLADHLGPSGLVEWLSRMRADRSLRDNSIGDAGELRLESDDDAVKVVTIHKSKGLEYPIVYCPFLWEGSELHADEKKRVRFHDASRENRFVLDLGSDQIADHLELASEESRAEAVRLLYVAVTRAKHRCSIVWGNFKKAGLSPLASLLHPSIESGSSAEAKSKQFGKLEDHEMRSEIAELVEVSGESIAVRELGAQPAVREKRVVAPRSLARTPVKRRISTTWRQSSFSALTASDHGDLHSLPRTREEGLDYDAVARVPALGQRAEIESEVQLNSFPAGAAAGTLLHSILEHLDFERPAREQSRELVGETLEAHGFEANWRDPLCSALDRIVETRWDEPGPRLADLPRRKRLDELEFLLPVASRAGDRSSACAMTVADLSEVFERHARSEFQREYAKRLSQLRFEPLAGYLKGYVDLVFEWNGRFYLVDYKSNHLGPSPANYDTAGLEVPMSEHHYVLQYHLYTVALDRYLSLRLKGYDYERHFGGVYYLFLRGMDPDHPTGRGIYHDRPTRECIEELAAALGQRAEGSA